MSVRLVYHQPGETLRVVSRIDQAIYEVVSGQLIDIACPYLGCPADLTRITDQSKDWRLLSDVDEWIRSQGPNGRREILDFIKENSERVRHYPDLHAKVIIATGKALVGSANFTTKGICERIEMCVLLERPSEVAELRDWFDRVWKLCDPEISNNELSRLIRKTPNPTIPDSRYRLSSEAPRIKSKLAFSTKKPSAPIAKNGRKARRPVERAVVMDHPNSGVGEAEPEATSGKPVNPGTFTAENKTAFNEKVGPADKNGCRPWQGWPTKNGKRRFGLFRRQGNGYVMNQRFAFIMAQPVAKRNPDIRVEPKPTCALFKAGKESGLSVELCCNPSHIRAQAEGTHERKAGAK